MTESKRLRQGQIQTIKPLKYQNNELHADLDNDQQDCKSPPIIRLTAAQLQMSDKETQIQLLQQLLQKAKLQEQQKMMENQTYKKAFEQFKQIPADNPNYEYQIQLKIQQQNNDISNLQNELANQIQKSTEISLKQQKANQIIKQIKNYESKHSMINEVCYEVNQMEEQLKQQEAEKKQLIKRKEELQELNLQLNNKLQNVIQISEQVNQLQKSNKALKSISLKQQKQFYQNNDQISELKLQLYNCQNLINQIDIKDKIINLQNQNKLNRQIQIERQITLTTEQIIKQQELQELKNNNYELIREIEKFFYNLEHQDEDTEEEADEQESQ